jgi:hypothetical protein
VPSTPGQETRCCLEVRRPRRRRSLGVGLQSWPGSRTVAPRPVTVAAAPRVKEAPQSGLLRFWVLPARRVLAPAASPHCHSLLFVYTVVPDLSGWSWTHSRDQASSGRQRRYLPSPRTPAE